MQFSLALHKPSQPYTPPEIKIPPPLNGTLRFRGTYPSIEFIKSLVNIQGGIHFRSVEMGDARKVPLQMVIDACSDTVESITFWTGYREYYGFVVLLMPKLTPHISGSRTGPLAMCRPEKAQDRTGGRNRYVLRPPNLPVQSSFEHCIPIFLHLHR